MCTHGDHHRIERLVSGIHFGQLGNGLCEQHLIRRTEGNVIVIPVKGLVIILVKADGLVQGGTVPEFHAVRMERRCCVTIAAQQLRKARDRFFHIAGGGRRFVLGHIKRGIHRKLGI
ncbi:hypothetical protein D3C76_1504170 [compost metagenome]